METYDQPTISHPAVSSTIPGVRTVRNVERNVPVSGKGPLDRATLDILKRHAWDRNVYDYITCQTGCSTLRDEPVTEP